MNTHFTQTAPQRNGRNQYLVKAFFAAVVASLGFVGTANAQMGVTITGGTTIPSPNPSTVVAYGSANIGTPTLLVHGNTQPYTGTALVENNPLFSSAFFYPGASGGNYLKFETGHYLEVRRIEVDNFTQLVFSMGVFLPAGSNVSDFKILYNVKNGNGVQGDPNASDATAYTLPATTPIGAWTRVDVTIPFTTTQNANIGLRFTNDGSTSILVDDIGVTEYATTCETTTSGQKTWKGIGAGGTDPNFNLASNWCPAGVPTATDVAVINATAAASINVSANTEVKRLVIVNATPEGSEVKLNVASGFNLTIGEGGLDVPVFSPWGVTFAGTPTSSIILKGNLTAGSPADVNGLNTTTFTGVKLNFNGAGSLVQEVSGVGRLVFGDVVINNTSTNDHDVRLLNNVLLTGTMSFANGIFTTGAMVMEVGPTGLITENETSFARGRIKVVRTITSSSSMVVTDPGFGGVGAWMRLPEGSTDSYDFSVTRESAITPIVYEYSNPSGSVKFTIDVEGARLIDPVASLQIRYAGRDLSTLDDPNEDKLALYKQVNGVWLNQANNGPNNTAISNLLRNLSDNTLRLIATTPIGQWVLGSTINPLPVELISFSAKRDADASVLEWRTAKEENNAGYEIEASSDNRNFKTIGYVNAMQTAYQGAEYSFVEPKAASYGVRYYRLTQYDIDGKKTVLGVRTVSFNTTGTSVITGPNPFTYGFAALVESDQAQAATLVLTDALGREVARQQTQLVRGINQVDFNGDELSTGSYILSVQLETEVLTIKVNKQ